MVKFENLIHAVYVYTPGDLYETTSKLRTLPLIRTLPTVPLTHNIKCAIYSKFCAYICVYTKQLTFINIVLEVFQRKEGKLSPWYHNSSKDMRLKTLSLCSHA